MSNPLIPAILTLLREYPQGISEYAMLRELSGHAGLAGIGSNGQLALFQKHFMVMNGLYQLQQRLWNEERLVLEISPLCIQLASASPAEARGGQPARTPSAALREYYLDWKNFEETTEEDVVKLLNDFWRRYGNTDNRQAALQVLDLERDASASEITQRYRQLAAEHHPDKGGDREAFIRIRQAYETLRNSGVR